MRNKDFLTVLAAMVLPVTTMGQRIGPEFQVTAPANQSHPAIASHLPPGISGDWWEKVQQDIRESEYNINWQGRALLPDPSTTPGHARPGRRPPRRRRECVRSCLGG